MKEVTHSKTVKTDGKGFPWFIVAVLLIVLGGIAFAMGWVDSDKYQPVQPVQDTIKEIITDAVGGRVGSQFPNGLVAGRFGTITASTRGILIASEEFTNGSSTEAWIDGVIAVTDTNSCWTNGTDAGVWVDYAIIGLQQGQIASSTMEVRLIATSTAVASTQDFAAFTNVASSSIIAPHTIATSTAEHFITASTTLTDTTNAPFFVSNGMKVCAYKRNGDLSDGFVEAQASGIYSTATSSDQAEIFWRFHYVRD